MEQQKQPERNEPTKDRAKIRKIVRGLILFAVYLFILFFLIRYAVNNLDTIEKIRSAPIRYSIISIVCIGVGLALTGVMDCYCIRVFNVEIGYGESIGLTYIASAVNRVLPLQLGSAVKAVYLKKKMDLAYSKYISIISGTIVINLMVTFVQLIVCLVICAFEWELDAKYIVLLFAVFAAGMAAFFLVMRFQDAILRILPFKKVSVPIMSGFFELMRSKKAVWAVTLNLVIHALLGGVNFSALFSMLGYDGGMLNSMLYFGIFNASSIIPILPGNIGISEAIVGLTNQILNSDFDIGVLVVLVYRVFFYLVTFAGALLAAAPVWILYNKNKGGEKS